MSERFAQPRPLPSPSQDLSSLSTLPAPAEWDLLVQILPQPGQDFHESNLHKVTIIREGNEFLVEVLGQETLHGRSSLATLRVSRAGVEATGGLLRNTRSPEKLLQIALDMRRDLVRMTAEMIKVNLPSEPSNAEPQLNPDTAFTRLCSLMEGKSEIAITDGDGLVTVTRSGSGFCLSLQGQMRSRGERVDVGIILVSEHDAAVTYWYDGQTFSQEQATRLAGQICDRLTRSSKVAGG